MDRTRWTLFCALIFVFALSTACLTFFPEPTQAAPTEPSDETIRGPLKFDPASLPNAQVGVPYEVEIRVTENVTPGRFHR